MRRYVEVIKDINELIVFKHSVFALPFIFIAMVVASNEVNGSTFFGWRLLILGLLAAVSARSYAMALNRYADKDIDIGNPRTASRPNVDGRIGKKNMQIFILINAFVFIFAAWMINDLAFYLSFPILLILGGYSIFKRFSPLAHMVLGLSLGLAPIAGVVAVTGTITLWSALLGLGVLFWVAGFDLLYALQDIEFDRKNNLYSIPSVYGESATFFISALFHGLATLFWLLFAWSAGLGVLGWIGIGINGVILWQEHKIVHKDFSKIDRAFFTLNGYLGIIFFFIVLTDRILA